MVSSIKPRTVLYLVDILMFMSKLSRTSSDTADLTSLISRLLCPLESDSRITKKRTARVHKSSLEISVNQPSVLTIVRACPNQLQLKPQRLRVIHTFLTVRLADMQTKGITKIESLGHCPETLNSYSN